MLRFLRVQKWCVYEQGSSILHFVVSSVASLCVRGTMLKRFGAGRNYVGSAEKVKGRDAYLEEPQEG